MTNRAIGTAACAAFLAALALPSPHGLLAQSRLIISEYVEGSSNSKAIELLNRTNQPLNLSTRGYQLWMYFNGATTATQMKVLSGTIPAGDVWVFANPSSDPAVLAVADQLDVNTIWYNGDDAVALVTTIPDTTVVDVIGQIGFDPGTEWGTGDTSTADNTLRRKADVCDGDTNGSDTFDPAVQWDGFALNTFSGLGSHTTTCLPVAVQEIQWGAIKQLYRE